MKAILAKKQHRKRISMTITTICCAKRHIKRIVIIKNERSTTYIYGQIATGIGQATVGGLGINGRTFILNGAQLALYNTAGQCVATGIGQVTAPAPGVYVLKSGRMSWKMMMK